jgi:hypothetical protein
MFNCVAVSVLVPGIRVCLVSEDPRNILQLKAVGVRFLKQELCPSAWRARPMLTPCFENAVAGIGMHAGRRSGPTLMDCIVSYL